MNLLLDVFDHSINLVSLFTSVSAWEDSSYEDAMGRATSMGGNGWNPKHT
jgi:hypothetical protein